MSEDILSEDQVAARYQVSARTLKRWRWRKYGPSWFYAGRHVRYHRDDIEKWEKAERVKAAS